MAFDRPTSPRERQSELRVSPRKATHLRCWVSSGLIERFVTLADLSAEGARIVTASPPPVGEAITVRLLLPGDDEPRDVILRARVVWRAEGFRGRGGVMGVAFERLSTAPERAAPELAAYLAEAD